MTEQIEIEFKNLLTETEFEHLLRNFHISRDQFITQRNHYFDTPEFLLKDRACALRIREKDGQYEMTLKQPLPTGQGLLETNIELGSETAQAILNGTPLPENEIINKIRLLGIED